MNRVGLRRGRAKGPPEPADAVPCARPGPAASAPAERDVEGREPAPMA